MWFRRIPKQEPGKPITAKSLREVAEAAEWATRIRADAPLAIAATAFGPLIRFVGQVLDIRVAVSTTSISYRSGGSPGSGQARLLAWTGGTLVDLPGPVVRTVFNISSNTAGIDSGKYMIIIRIAGDYFIITSEC